jgi:uncharacterized damage-inducible protein DinB
MVTKQNNKLNQFADFLTWIEKLRKTRDGLWLQPLAEGKWSIREILVHIMHWDKNSLEMMVPAMTEGAKLFFVDIQKHNEQAEVLAQSYSDLNVLLNDVVKTRQRLLELLRVTYNDCTQFTINNKDYTFERFVDVFIHHDEHHIKQMEAFLEQEGSR